MRAGGANGSGIDRHQKGLGGSNDAKAVEFTAAHIASVLALTPADHPPSRIDAPTAGAIA
jgi:hypothetical protein